MHFLNHLENSSQLFVHILENLILENPKFLLSSIQTISNYYQSLTSYLHDNELLTDSLKTGLLEHNNDFNNKRSIKLNFGKYQGKTVSEVAQFDQKYLNWLVQQTLCFDDVKEEVQ